MACFDRNTLTAVTREVELENRDCFQDDQSSAQEVDESVEVKSEGE